MNVTNTSINLEEESSQSTLSQLETFIDCLEGQRNVAENFKSSNLNKKI